MALKKIPSDQFRPLSLVQYFEPPENYTGTFGWICGYSADTDFLNLAMERFTGKTKNIRSRDGLINVILMLDKGNPQISMVHVPGVYHPGRDMDKVQPFRLLHAKLALLYFKSIENPRKSFLRLLVSTGNWTCQTLSESLDLVCCLDLSSNDFTSSEYEKKQTRADILAAWDLMKELRNYFPHSISTANRDKETYISCNTFEQILSSISKPKGCVSRLFDNRNYSLLDQLPELIKKTGSDNARNYLALGSRFYQKPHSSGKVPSVIHKIFHSLQDEYLLTKNPEKELFINSEACQAVAKSIENLIENCWTVREAVDPLDMKRELHAKFIFSANQREGYNSCSSAWLYLGSGNLTEAGFTNKMSSIKGNLEVGIVLSPGSLYWQYEKRVSPEECVDKLLPMNWDDDTTILLKADLHAGEDMADRDEDYKAAPVSWFNWIEKDGAANVLEPGENCEIGYQLINPENIFCLKDNVGNWVWNYSQPSVVKVKWGPDFKFDCIVPVIDSFGRIAGKQLNTMDLNEAWWQLDGYPDFIGDEDDDEDIESPEIDLFQNDFGSKSGSVRTESYPIRKMMELVEKIADKQTGIAQRDWKIWCNRLEQCLFQTRDSEIYELFRKMNLNPLAPLRQEPFRPEYAKDNNTDEGEYYELVLDKIENSLNLSNLKSL